MRRTRAKAFLVSVVLAASAHLVAQTPPPPPSVTVLVDGAPVDAEVFVFSGKPKPVGSTGSDGVLAFDPKLLTDKGVNVAAGTPMAVYRLTCKDGKMRVLLAPESVSKQELGCADRDKPIVEGQDCGCDRIGGVIWGSDMRVATGGGGGWSPMTKTIVWGGAAAAGVTAVILATNNNEDTFKLSTFSGTYSGTFNQVSTTCNPPAFVQSFAGTVTLTVSDSGQATLLIHESIDRTYTGTLTKGGGTLNGSGTFPSGTPWTGTVQVTLTEGTPARISVVETITNGRRSCDGVFRASDLPKQ